MTTAAIVIAALAVAYCAVITGYCWYRRSADRLDDALRGEHRPGSQPSAVVFALAALNRSYRFRRYSDDEQLVTRTFSPPVSALAEESR